MTATVTLADAEEGGTLLTYVAEAQVGGKLAAEFFKRFNTTMSESSSASVEEAGRSSETSATRPTKKARNR